MKSFQSESYELAIPSPERSKCDSWRNQIAHLWGTETVYPPLSLSLHYHNAPSFYVVLEGSLTETNRIGRWELNVGRVVFHPPAEVHSNAFHAVRSRCFLVELEPHWIERLKKLRIKLEQFVEANDPELAWLTARLRKEFREPDNISPLAAEGLGLEILARLSRQEINPLKSLPTWLHNAQELLNDRFSETITLEEIARAVGVHPVHLSRAFRQRYSCSIGDYQRRLRVEHASRLLSTTKVPLVEVALSSGFSDQAHFSRVFKKITGMTPAAFRQVMS